MATAIPATQLAHAPACRYGPTKHQPPTPSPAPKLSTRCHILLRMLLPWPMRHSRPNAHCQRVLGHCCRPRRPSAQGRPACPLRPRKQFPCPAELHDAALLLPCAPAHCCLASTHLWKCVYTPTRLGGIRSTPRTSNLGIVGSPNCLPNTLGMWGLRCI